MLKKLSFIATLFTAIILTGCANLITQNLETDEISITLNFGNENARTVNPEFDVTKLTDIALKGTVEGESEKTYFTGKTYAEITGEENKIILSKAGNYSFTLTAKLNERKYSSTINCEIIGGNNALSFPLSFTGQDATFAEGNGSFSVNVIITNHENLENAKVTLKTKDGKIVYNEETVTKQADGKFTYEKSDVPAGSYRVSFEFYNTASQLMGYYQEVINVSKDLNSSATRTIESIDTESRYLAGTCGDNATYLFNSKTLTLTISGRGAINEYAFYIENNIDLEKQITKIVKNVVIKNGITEIKKYAFQGSNLESIIIPDSVTELGVYVLCNCSNLKSITAPCRFKNYEYFDTYYLESDPTITWIHSYTEDNTTCDCGEETQEILTGSCGTSATYKYGKISKTLFIYGSGTISNSSFIEEILLNAKRIEIGNEITDINNNFFTGFINLLFLKAPCRFIDYPIFNDKDCEWEHLYTEDNEYCECGKESRFITGTCGTSATYSFDKATFKLTISGSNKIINHAFSLKYGEEQEKQISKIVKNVIIENGITGINDYAFEQSNLKSITIPDSVTDINRNVFKDCTNLTSITAPCRLKGNENLIDKTVTWIHIYKGLDSICLCGEKNQEILSGKCGNSATFKYGKESKILFISGTGIVNKGELTDDILSNVKRIEIKSGISNISITAFRNCTNLQSVKGPCKIKGIPFFKNYECEWVHSYTGENTKCDCGECNYRYLTGSCGRPDVNYVFDNSTLLLTIKGYDAVETYAFAKGFNTKNPEIVENVVIEDGITEIKNYAFRGSNLESIIIPNSVIKLGIGIFENCSNLTSITVPSRFKGNDNFDSKIIKSNPTIIWTES